jgi:uncharacterized protein YjbI with pentapeptide repeats/endonuclease YncB( thermonuclease family)
MSMPTGDRRGRLKFVGIAVVLSVVAVAIFAIGEFGTLRRVSGAILGGIALIGLALWWADSTTAKDSGSREWSDLGRSLLVGGLIAFAVWLIGNFQREDEQRHSLQLSLGQQQQLPDIDLRNENLSEFDLAGKDLSRADLAGATLSEADLQETNLAEADLTRATLTDAKLEGADLSGADLGEADLDGVEANLVNLSGAMLAGADLSSAQLSGANLEGACLANATLDQAFLPDAELTDAALTDTDLQGAVFWYDLRPATLTSVGLNRALHAGTARWPPGYRYQRLVNPNSNANPPAPPPLHPMQVRTARVRSVFDGDTLTLITAHSPDIIPVRLIGINAPDFGEGGGLTARNFLRKLLPTDSKVMYQQDRLPEDEFKRHLLYVFLPDGRLVNQVMLQNGQAIELDSSNDRHGNNLYSEKLAASEAWARERALGLWQSCPS